MDRESIQAYGKELEAQVNQLHDEIIEEVGYEFNINSPKQLGEALFGKLGLPTGRRQRAAGPPTPTCWRSCGCSTRWVDKVLRYRTVAKLKSTYCDGLLKVIGPDGRGALPPSTRRRHAPAASPAPSPTCRTSPCAPPSARELRKFFAGSGGNLLVDADYSQIELRVLAHVADDAAMKEGLFGGPGHPHRYGGPRVPNARGHGHQGHAL